MRSSKMGIVTTVFRSSIVTWIFVASMIAQPVSAAAPGTLYVDSTLRFSLSIPSAFTADAGSTDGSVRRWIEQGGDAQLEVYGGVNKDALGIVQFASMLEHAGNIRTVTYRRIGDSWLVLSGYRQDNETGEPVIFYAKFMFSAGLERFGAFEISYPLGEKRRLDPVVEQLEDTLHAPR